MGRKLGKAMSSVHWLLLATMVAVELLMSFSFLGYFHIEPISITIAYIPVLIAGALGGPAESLVVGCAFGLASMWKASATYVMDFDQLFSPFLSGHPWESLFLSVGARALFGLAVGLLSMALLVVLFMIFNRRYATFKAYEGTLDPLTGLMTRRAFFQTCSRVLREQQPQGGYFLMVDLDHLKEINDTFGHPEGDRVIRQVGQCLKDSFGEQALAARMGGDEFALLLWEPISRQELEVALRHFTEKIHGFTWGDGRPVSCSAGALPLTGPCAPEELYRDADLLLYAAKQNGRDQFLIGEPER